MKRTIAMVGVILAMGCAKKDEVATDTTKMPDEPMPPAATMPAAQITSPANGDSVQGPDVMVKMSATGITIEKASGTHVDGVGHFHLFLDSPVSAEDKPIPANTAMVVHIGTGDSTYTFKGVKPGAHELIVVAAGGDHIPMATRRDTVRFVVK
jgi:hypothetical protein